MTPDRRAFLATSAVALGLAATRADEPNPRVGNKTKFAVNIEMWFNKLKTYPERIAASAQLGYDGVEFWPWRGKNLNAIQDACGKHGVKIAQFSAWGFKPGMNDPKNHQHFVEEIEASCEIAKKLDVKQMCVVGGDDIAGMTQPEMHEQIIVALKRAAPIAQKHDVTLILEPMNIRVDHKGHCLYGSEAGVKIIRAVGSTHVKLLFDLYHNHITEGDLCGHIRDGFKELGYIQVADHPGRTEPGTGEIHYNRVFKELWALGYRGYVGLECRPLTTEALATEGVRRSDVW